VEDGVIRDWSMMRLEFGEQGDTSQAGTNDLSRLRISSDAALQAAQAAALDTTRLTRLLTILSEPAPLTLLLDRVLSTLSELFFADIVVLLDPAGTGSFSPLAAIGLPEDIIHQPMSDAEGGYVMAAMKAMAPVLIAQASTDPKVDPQLRDLGAETAVWLPVMNSHTAQGVLVLARCRPVPFTHAEVGLLTAMAYRIGLALEQAQRTMQLEQIIRAGQEIGRHLDKSNVASTAVQMFPALMGADAAALVMNDPGGTPLCVAQAGLDSVWSSAFSHLADGLLKDAQLATVEPYCTSDLPAAFNQFSLEFPKNCPVQALLAVPIQREERIQGLLYAMRFSITSFSPDSLRVARLYSGQISAALENARLYRALRDELTERVRAEQERERLEARLRQAQRMEAIGTFAGGIAHDFNNLLGAIIGNIDLAQLDMDEKAESFRSLENALNAAKQAADLTREIITFSAGGHPIKVITPAKNLIMDAVSLSLSGSNVKVEYGFPDDLWEVEVDQTQMKQALSNIAVNSKEAMPNGGIVKVTAENVEMCPLTDPSRTTVEKGRYVKVVITDHGKGIPTEALPKIYDPYFSTKQRGREKGMGLGLATALSIINKHRGTIQVESQLGQGTTFHVLLPAYQTVRKEGTTPLVAPSSQPIGKARLLLLEDEEMVSKMTITMLHRLGFEDVVHAWEGMEAVERFTQAQQSGRPFDLVILDLTVKGGQGGQETIKQLIKINPSLKAIVASGYSRDPVMSRYANYGFCGSLCKPYRMEDLRAAIEAALGQ
jgi:signal transduction histidine kinase/ActR/RegA family two-component response regulator